MELCVKGLHTNSLLNTQQKKNDWIATKKSSQFPISWTKELQASISFWNKLEMDKLINYDLINFTLFIDFFF